MQNVYKPKIDRSNVDMPKVATKVAMPALAHSSLISRWVLCVAMAFAALTPALAQQSPFSAAMKTAMFQPVSPSPLAQRGPGIERPHHFLDRENAALFAAVGAMNAADFYVTRQNLAHGGTELNPLTRPFAGSTAGLAFNFAGETAGYIGISYLFHKTGHHKLERLTSWVSIGGSGAAVAYDLAHR